MNLNAEQALFAKGYKLVGGLDEAGRGPLAGPVVAACVVIGNDFSLDDPDLQLIKDSKKLSAKQREKLFGVIKNKVLAVEIGVCDEQIIDKINILQASFLAMRRALEKISLKPSYVLVDGKFSIPKIDTPQQAIIGGDNQVFCIAAASIIAKVTRDYLMQQIDKKYPQYEFAKHKGYGTKLHLEKIKALGPTPIHRRTFAPLKDWFPLTKKPRR